MGESQHPSWSRMVTICLLESVVARPLFGENLLAARAFSSTLPHLQAFKPSSLPCKTPVGAADLSLPDASKLNHQTSINNGGGRDEPSLPKCLASGEFWGLMEGTKMNEVTTAGMARMCHAHADGWAPCSSTSVIPIVLLP